MKASLKAQFGPGNQAWIARNQLLTLKHTDKIQIYIKEFLGLMLEIKDMSEEEQAFPLHECHVVMGVKWLVLPKHADHCQAITAVDKLLDFRGEAKGNQ